MKITRAMHKKINVLKESVEKTRVKMLAEWNVPADSTGAGIIAEYCQNTFNILMWQLQRDAGGSVSTRDLANFQKIKASLMKTLTLLKKTNEAGQEDAEEIEAAEDAAKTGEDLNPNSPHYSIHRAIACKGQADWECLVACEKGDFGEEGKTWAKNVRKSHRIIWQLNKAIAENMPTEVNNLVKKLRKAKMLAPPALFDIEEKDIPAWLTL